MLVALLVLVLLAGVMLGRFSYGRVPRRYRAEWHANVATTDTRVVVRVVKHAYPSRTQMAALEVGWVDPGAADFDAQMTRLLDKAQARAVVLEAEQNTHNGYFLR